MTDGKRTKWGDGREMRKGLSWNLGAQPKRLLENDSVTVNFITKQALMLMMIEKRGGLLCLPGYNLQFTKTKKLTHPTKNAFGLVEWEHQHAINQIKWNWDENVVNYDVIYNHQTHISPKCLMYCVYTRVSLPSPVGKWEVRFQTLFFFFFNLILILYEYC